MRYLIVNADDFGGSSGINRGILEAHREGIVTSASLMVDAPGATEASNLARENPRLGLGLHLRLSEANEGPRGLSPPERVRADLLRQLKRFHALVGDAPTHVDVHRNRHRDDQLLPCFLDVARLARAPLREHCRVRYFSRFYGRWDGVSHPEQIAPDALVEMLRSEVSEGFTELSCHPGYPEPSYPSSYLDERRREVRTLCDPRVRQAIREEGIRLINFRAIMGLVEDMSFLPRSC